MASWTRLVKPLLDLVLPPPCPLCQRQAPALVCPDCLRQVQQCRMPDAERFWQGDLPLFPWGVYGGALRRAIASMKYENRPQLARPLGQALGQAWLASPQVNSRLVVVPIPLHASKLKKRGFNQAERLAAAFCQVTGLPLCPDGLVRVRETEAQFQLAAAEREANLSEAFVLGQSLRQYTTRRAVLLLDDIYTTGATVRAAVKPLQQQGIRVYGLAAIAASAAMRDAKLDGTTSPPYRR